jgi:hypothetical protein
MPTTCQWGRHWPRCGGTKAGEGSCAETAPIVSGSCHTRPSSLAATISTSGYVGFPLPAQKPRCVVRLEAGAVFVDPGADFVQNLFEPYPGADLSSLTRLFCGGLAGITSVCFTYPLDIVRTRLSIQSASFAELGSKPKQLPGMWATMITMYKTEGGILALYRGIIPTVAGVAPYVGYPALNFHNERCLDSRWTDM